VTADGHDGWLTSDGAAFDPRVDRLGPGESIRTTVSVSALVTGTTMRPHLTLYGVSVPATAEGLYGNVRVGYTPIAYPAIAVSDDEQSFAVDLTVTVGAAPDDATPFGGYLDLTGAMALLLTNRTWWDEAPIEGLGSIAIGRPGHDVPEPPEQPGDPDEPGLLPELCPSDWDPSNVALAGSEPPGGWGEYDGWQHCLPISDLEIPGDVWSFIPTLPLWLYRATERAISGIMFIPAESEPAGVLNSAWNTAINPVGNGIYSTELSLSFSTDFIRDVIEGRSDGRFRIALRDTGTDYLPYTFFLVGRLTTPAQAYVTEADDDARKDDDVAGTSNPDHAGSAADPQEPGDDDDARTP
jgi:hypothetical protein